MNSTQSGRLSSDMNLTADNATNHNLIILNAKGLSNVVTEKGSLVLSVPLIISTVLILAYVCYSGVVYGGVNRDMLFTYSACITAVAIYPFIIYCRGLGNHFSQATLKKPS